MKIPVVFSVIVLAGLFAITSCRHTNPVMQAKDDSLTVQVMALKRANDDNRFTAYRARVIPSKAMIQRISAKEKEALYYRMDSSFYVNDKEKRVYASLIQPVANGVSGTYEYLLQFESDDQPADGVNMVYQDKYLTKKIYNLKIDE